MNNTINGRTPEEIKKGIYCCYINLDERECGECPYIIDDVIDCDCTPGKDAYDYIRQLENQIGELTEKVAQLEAAQPKWISVEERLPKQYVSVLVYMPDEYPRPIVHEGYLRPDGLWELAHYLCTPDEVTHWANLPDQPKDDA